MAWVRQFTYPKMFYLILEIQTRVGINIGTATNNLFPPCSMLEKMFMSKKMLVQQPAYGSYQYTVEQVNSVYFTVSLLLVPCKCVQLKQGGDWNFEKEEAHVYFHFFKITCKPKTATKGSTSSSTSYSKDTLKAYFSNVISCSKLRLGVG